MSCPDSDGKRDPARDSSQPLEHRAAPQTLGAPPASDPTPADRERWAEIAREVERLTQTDPHAGVARAEGWLADERDAEGHARALSSVAKALLWSGAHDRAEPRFAAAEAAFIALGLKDDAALVRIGHVEAFRYLGRYDEAIALAQSNLAYLRSRGETFVLDAGRQTVNLGLVYWRRGDLEGAYRCFEEARATFAAAGRRDFVAIVSVNLGLILIHLGRFREALEVNRFAASEQRALGNRERLATVLMNLGLLHISRGEYGQALEALLESRTISDELGLAAKRAAVDVDLTRAYRALGLDAEASERCSGAIETFRRLDLPFELATALLVSGQLAERRGDTIAARQDLTEARALYSRVGNHVWEAVAGLAELRLAVAEASRRALPDLLAEAMRYAERLDELGSPEHAATGHLLVADIQARLDRAEDARATLATALALGRKLGADGVLYQAHLAEGLLLELDEPDEARASYERAVEHLERLRAHARADDLKLAVVGQGESLYERIARLLLGSPPTHPDACAPRRQTASNRRAREAFRWLERGKSRGLLEDTFFEQVHAPNPSSRLTQARERVGELRAELNAAYTSQYAAETPAARSASATATDLGRLERDLSLATRELQILMRGDDGLDVTTLIDVERLQASLDETTCLLEYLVLGDEIACFVVRRGHFAVYRQLASRPAVEKALGWLWFHIRKGTYGAEFLRSNQHALSRSVGEALQQLSELLLTPISSALVDAKHIVVVPHSMLHGVPIHALMHEGGILLERTTVSYAPSAAVFASTSSRPTHAIERPLIVAPEIADLPWVREEARRIAEQLPGALILSGQDATLERVRHEAPAYDSLHLATHGVFRADNPTYSALELADGWLSVGELAELSRDKSLVCLSACHTGMSGVGPGDELVGLTRAVLGAGAGALIASLWAANDDTAPAFMSAVYAGLRSGNGRADSLRAAALEMRAREPHPYFWAPFILVGAP